MSSWIILYILSGTNCETEIDECASNPCVNGTCVNMINAYSCDCVRGFYGSRCENETDECQVLTPCLHNATCHDRVADYDCECPALVQSTLYGGKNCSVELTGCVVNDCQNDAICRPYLVNETLNLHSYTCQCTSGFYGGRCNVSTAATFSSSVDWIEYSTTLGQSELKVSFKFRTTLPDGVLLTYMDKVTLGDIKMSLESSSLLRITYTSDVNDTGVNIVIFTPGFQALNDGNWHPVELRISKESLTASLHHDSCSQGRCNESMALNLTQFNGNVLFFGGNFSQTAVGAVFVGCMEDIVISSDWIILQQPLNNMQTSPGIVSGCSRREQCTIDPCNGRGKCSDLWDRFSCTCQRPYWGITCKNSE